MIMTPKWLIPALGYLCFVEGQSPCSTPNGKSGDCRIILECPPLRSAANKPSKTPAEVNFLKRSACGFIDDIPKVCCGFTNTCITPEGDQGLCKSIIIIIIMSADRRPLLDIGLPQGSPLRPILCRSPPPNSRDLHQVVAPSCWRPTDCSSSGKSIFECKHIAEMLQSPMVTAATKAYVNTIRCESPKGFSVCCGPPPAPPQTGCEPSAVPPDPRSKCCGIDGSSGDKIVGGNATSIDQYPWLAIIENRKGDQIKVLCGGVLISGRYVLTAAHCVVGSAQTVGTPVNVRLGEYDITNPGRDCVPVVDGSGLVDCTEEPVVIAIERVVSHPGYNTSSPLRRNDIAMLRLKELAPYTDFIRPICLPTRDVTMNILSTVRFVAAGWGPNNETHANSDVKLHVDLPYKSIESCQPAYDVPKRRVPLWRGQLCAGGERGKDTCKGDSGGPLMLPTDVLEVVGIVSFGALPCGLEDVPGVYTNVYEYLPWIRSNILL